MTEWKSVFSRFVKHFPTRRRVEGRSSCRNPWSSLWNGRFRTFSLPGRKLMAYFSAAWFHFREFRKGSCISFSTYLYCLGEAKCNRLCKISMLGWMYALVQIHLRKSVQVYGFLMVIRPSQSFWGQWNGALKSPVSLYSSSSDSL